jgi:hypothetical protein
VNVKIPFCKVHHDISGRWPLNFDVDVLPGHPRAHVGLDSRFTGLVEVTQVFLIEGPEEGVVRCVVTAIC